MRWQRGLSYNPDESVGILHLEAELLPRTISCQPRRENVRFLHHSNKIPLKSCWGNLWARGGQPELAGAVLPCGAGPVAMSCLAGSGASPTWAGMLSWAVLAVSAANLGRLHAAHGKCRGSLRKLLLRWRAMFLLAIGARGEKIAVF